MADIAGQRFGKLIAVSPQTVGGRLWLVRCDCGTEKTVTGSNLRHGITRSCGCNSSRATIGQRRYKDGRTRTPIYAVWNMMQQRCYNPKNKRWSHYGGRGIAVCPKWRTFDGFLEDMGPGWAPGLSIERVDNDGNYEPSNCTWIPRGQQSLNRRTLRWIESPWGRVTASEAARRLGMNLSSFILRLDKGWIGDRLFSEARRWS